MTFLAIDTAMAACSAAVQRAAGSTGEWQAMERGHAEALPPMVERVVAAAGLTYADLERIVVTVGPGTFTGLRIGLSMARGLGLALGIPVTGIDSLRAIAANVEACETPLLVVADARRDEVYAALYRGDGAELLAPRVIRTSALLPLLPPGAVTVIGTGADAVLAASGRGDLRRSTAGDLPDARRFGFAAGLPASDRMPEPLYLRAPDAKPQAGAARTLPGPVFMPADAALLAALHGQCFDGAPWTEAFFSQLLAMPGSLATVAAVGGEPAAFILTRQAADEAEIITVGVTPSARRRGIGRALLQHQFTMLRTAGAVACFIEVAESNAAARALYDGAGFRVAGQRRGYYERAGGAREDARVMRRDLAR